METKDWISTKDRLPETNNDIDKFTHCSDEVLICLNGNEVVTGNFFKIDYDCITTLNNFKAKMLVIDLARKI